MYQSDTSSASETSSTSPMSLNSSSDSERAKIRRRTRGQIRAAARANARSTARKAARASDERDEQRAQAARMAQASRTSSSARRAQASPAARRTQASQEVINISSDESANPEVIDLTGRTSKKRRRQARPPTYNPKMSFKSKKFKPSGNSARRRRVRRVAASAASLGLESSSAASPSHRVDAASLGPVEASAASAGPSRPVEASAGPFGPVEASAASAGPSRPVQGFFAKGNPLDAENDAKMKDKKDKIIYPQDYRGDSYARPSINEHVDIYMIEYDPAKQGEWDRAREIIYDSIISNHLKHIGPKKRRSTKEQETLNLNICGHLPLDYILKAHKKLTFKEFRENPVESKETYMETMVPTKPLEGETRNVLVIASTSSDPCVGYMFASKWVTDQGIKRAYIDLICSFNNVGSQMITYFLQQVDDVDEVRLNAVMTVLYYYNKFRFKFGDSCDTPYGYDPQMRIDSNYWNRVLSVNNLPRELLAKLKKLYADHLIGFPPRDNCSQSDDFNIMYDKGCADTVKMIYCPRRGWVGP